MDLQTCLRLRALLKFIPFARLDNFRPAEFRKLDLVTLCKVLQKLPPFRQGENCRKLLKEDPKTTLNEYGFYSKRLSTFFIPSWKLLGIRSWELTSKKGPCHGTLQFRRNQQKMSTWKSFRKKLLPKEEKKCKIYETWWCVGISPSQLQDRQISWHLVESEFFKKTWQIKKLVFVLFCKLGRIFFTQIPYFSTERHVHCVDMTYCAKVAEVSQLLIKVFSSGSRFPVFRFRCLH